MPDLQIYSLEWCPYCIKAKALLKAKEIPYRETDVTYDRELALDMVERSGRNNVPQIFVNGEHVGGYAELAHLSSTGALDRAFGREPVEPRDVYDVAVIGGGAAGLSAALYGKITLKDGVAEIDDLKKELNNHVRKEIGPIAVPDKIQFAPGLPKTRSGKIMRRILRKIAENAVDQIGDTTTLADPHVVEVLVQGKQ